MSIADSIANLIIQQGAIRGNQAQQIAQAQARAQELNAEAQARAQIASGQVWGSTIQSLGQLPGQIYGQYKQQQTTDLENQQRQLQIQRAQQVMQGEQAGQSIWSQIAQPDGSLDASGLMKNPQFAKMLPEQQQAFVKQVDDYNTVHQKFTQQRTDHAAQIADSALKTAQASGEPLSVLGASLWLNTAAQSGIATPQDVQQIQKALVAGADPTRLFQTIRAQGSQFKLKTPSNEAEVFYNAALGDPAAIQAAAKLKPPTEWTSALQAAGGDVSKAFDLTHPGTQTEFGAALKASGGDVAKAIAMIHPPTQRQPTEYDSFQNAWASTTAGVGKQWSDLTPQQQLAGIEKFKTMSTDQTALAAADRQAKTIAAQVAQQGRAQDFAESQAARGEYQKNVALPFQKALGASQTLRDTVAAAKAGNKVAANMQDLATAMADVKSMGFNRFNAAELGLPASAGDVWDRLQSGIGKLVAGQKVPEDLQNDMLAFADILDRNATNTYRKGRQSLLDTYQGVKLPDESAASGIISVSAPNGKTYYFSTQKDADVFKTKAGIK